MKNFGISTKKFVRKITAIASATLMAGLSMGAATASLSTLSSTFIQSGEFNAYVVVGTGGASNVVGFAKDVAGSIVVASAFAQQAKTTTATSGSATLSRNVTTGFLNGSYLGFGGSVPTTATSWTNADSGFSWLPNATVANSTSSSYANVTAKLSAAANTFFLEKTGNYTLTTDAITYNLTFNSDFSTAGNKGVGNGTQGIPFPDGKSYQITNWTVNGAGTATDALNVTLGDYTSVTATTGQVYSVGSTGISFEVLSYTSTPSAKLKIKVLDASGNVLFNDYVSTGAEIYKNSDVALILSEYYVPNGVVDATIQWTTSATVLRQGREHSSFPGWKVYMTNNSNGITSIAWKYAPEGTTVQQLLPGESKSMLGGFFNVVAGAFDINSTGKNEKTVTIYEAQDTNKDIYFVDANGTTHSIDLNLKSDSFTSAVNLTTVSSWIDGHSFTMKCWELADGSETLKVNLTRGEGYDTLEITNGTPFNINNGIGGGNVTNFEVIANLSWTGATKCTDARYNLTVTSFTSLGGNPINSSIVYNITSAAGMTNAWSNVSASGINGTVTFTENDTKTVVVTYEKGTLKTVTAESGNVELTGTTTRYTPYGSKIVKGTTLTISYPDSKRHGRLSVGRAGAVDYELTQGGYNKELDVTLKSAAGSSVQVNRIDVSLAKLDSEVTSSSVDKPVILIGGWAVNSLVNELVSAGLIDTTELSMDRAMVKLIDNAFNSKSALVIAGYEGDDTRLAAQVVASQVLGTMSILDGSSAILNTGVGSYSEVIVV